MRSAGLPLAFRFSKSMCDARTKPSRTCRFRDARECGMVYAGIFTLS
jgi:hypothetical protein